MLFEAGSHGTATGLALLSREELAKSRTLFALWNTRCWEKTTVSS